MLNEHPSRVKYDNEKMYRWKSWDGNTSFAPSWDISFYLDQLGDDITNDLRELISAQDICRDPDRLKWMKYNIFSWDANIIGVLSDRIYQVYSDYVNELDQDPLPKNKIWIRGWGVTLDKEQSLKHHSHSFHENTFLSGNISLSDLQTTTDYYFPYLSWYFGYFKILNTPGAITVFPSWLEHKVAPNKTGQLRYTVGFDMFTEHTINYISENRNESSELQNIILLSKRMDMI